MLNALKCTAVGLLFIAAVVAFATTIHVPLYLALHYGTKWLLLYVPAILGAAYAIGYLASR